MLSNMGAMSHMYSFKLNKLKLNKMENPPPQCTSHMHSSVMRLMKTELRSMDGNTSTITESLHLIAASQIEFSSKPMKSYLYAIHTLRLTKHNTKGLFSTWDFLIPTF